MQKSQPPQRIALRTFYIELNQLELQIRRISNRKKA